MSLKAELEAWTYGVFKDKWETREGTKIPDDNTQLGLKNEAIEIDGTVLYADLADSTAMVDSKTRNFSAEIYKTFLYCAAKIIREHEGTITAYDGDRIMAVYIGGSKNSNAVRSALKLRAAVIKIIEPQMKRVYSTDFKLAHVTGIDTSKLFIAKTGVRGANDLVWVGRSANHAAKLSSLPASYTYITKAVYDNMSKDAKTSRDKNMWEPRTWTAMNGAQIYRSSWHWSFS